MEFAGDDLLDNFPKVESGGDVYFFMDVFHTFNDRDHKKILQNLRTIISDKFPYVVITDAIANKQNRDANVDGNIRPRTKKK